MNTKDFLNTLFEPHEYICLATELTDVETYKLEDIQILNHQWIAINPYHKNQLRDTTHLKKYKNMLFEIDDLSLEEQKLLEEVVGFPHTTKVFSGRKSYHYIICFSESLKLKDYRKIFAWLNAVLGKYIDPKVGHPSVFTRLPGSIRKETGKEQELLTNNKRYYTKEEVYMWLSRFPEKEPKRKGFSHTRVSTNKKPERLNRFTKKMIEEGEYFGKSRHDATRKSALNMFESGYNEDEVYTILYEKFWQYQADKKEEDLERLVRWAEKTIKGLKG